jgi:hypothetical protein
MANEIVIYRKQAYRRRFTVSDEDGLVDLTGKTIAFRFWERIDKDDYPKMDFTTADPQLVILNQGTNLGAFELVLDETDTDMEPVIGAYVIWDETLDVPIVTPTRMKILAGGRA